MHAGLVIICSIRVFCCAMTDDWYDVIPVKARSIVIANNVKRYFIFS